MPPDRTALARRGRRRLIAVAATATAALLGLGMLYPGRVVPPGAGTYSAAPGDPLTTSLGMLESFVERERGLRFTEPVRVSVTDPATLRHLATETPTGADTRRPPDRGATDRALHLGEAGPVVPVAVAAGISYSPQRRTLFRTASASGPVARAALVHELVRALDDQHFDLDTLMAKAAEDADRGRALAALIDGDATRIEQRYLATLPAAERAAVASARAAAAPRGDYPRASQDFAPDYGTAFVTALIRDGGTGALDRAFAAPPVATAQILRPEQYLAGTVPVTVIAPTVPGAVVDAGSLGRFGWAMVLSGGRRVLDVGAAAAVVGDAYATFGSASGYCTWGSVVVEAGAQQQLLTDLRRHLGPDGSAEPFSSDTVRYRSCG